MKKKLLILAGGYSKEREISFKTAKAVFKQIKKDYICKIIDPKNNIPSVSLLLTYPRTPNSCT